MDLQFCIDHSWRFRPVERAGRRVFEGAGFCPRCSEQLEVTLSDAAPRASVSCPCSVSLTFTLPLPPEVVVPSTDA